jgi:hypothetical protein
MSLISVFVDYVKSGKLVKLLAKAKSLTIVQIYDEMGRVLQEALATYVPAIATAIAICRRVKGCEGELIKLRVRIVRGICEFTKLDSVIEWLVGILKKIPDWLLTVLQDVADVWKVIDQWSKGNFSLYDLQVIWNAMSHYFGDAMKSAVNAAGKAVLGAGEKLGEGVIWFADANAYVLAYTTRQVEEVATLLTMAPHDEMVSLLKEAGLGPIAEAIDAPVALLKELGEWGVSVVESVVDAATPTGSISEPVTS